VAMGAEKFLQMGDTLGLTLTDTRTGACLGGQQSVIAEG
jgi:hypothetical protein